MRHANLRGANLRHAYLEGADLTGANIKGAAYAHVDLRRAEKGPQEGMAALRKENALLREALENYKQADLDQGKSRDHELQ